MNFSYQTKRWLYPLIALIVMAPFTPSMDVWWSSLFYSPETKRFVSNAFTSFVFHYLQLPAFLTFGLAILMLCGSYVIKKLAPYKNDLLVMILAMILGPGLIINVVLKPGWGRPRPRQVSTFSGGEEYLPFYVPNLGYKSSDKYKSFPSGHASMGFYFFVVAVIGERRGSKPLAWSGFALAIVLGLVLGLTRIAQGGHFFTDVLCSALITWWVALFSDWVVFGDLKKPAD